MFKKFVKVIHSAVWWVDWLTILLLGILFDTVVWPGNRSMYRKSEYFWAWSLMKVGGIRLEIEGRENLPKDETVVYMANHQSDLDWPIIFLTVPGQYLFLAKKELFDAPVFGTYMRIQKYIPIERTHIRESLKTYEAITELIKGGNSIVIYPEGTRSRTKELQRFKSFSFTFLREAKVRVVPIAIDGSIDIQKKGSRLITPGNVKVSILPPISFDDIHHLDNKEFCTAASQRVRGALLKKLCLFLLCFFTFAFASPVFAGNADVEKLSYVCRDTRGTERWHADAEIKNKSGNVYTMVEKAEGYYSGFKGRISWVAQLEFESTEDNIRPIKLDKHVFDQEGNTLRVEKQEFDLASNTGVCTHEDPTRNIYRTRKFKFNKDIVNRLSLGLYARKFIAAGKTRERLQMVSEEPNVYDIELSIVGKEAIDVNGIKRMAYRLSIDPQLGFLNFAKILLPKAYAWHSTDPGFVWLRYAGLEGDINSRKVEVTTRK
jgi:1-acyl-sn-glycerol-3-phosphate acyltransferase